MVTARPPRIPPTGDQWRQLSTEEAEEGGIIKLETTIELPAIVRVLLNPVGLTWVSDSSGLKVIAELPIG